MFRPTLPPPTPRRRGAILIVVLALLALFAVIGLAFVFYADSEAQIARLHKEAQGREGGGPPALPQAEYDKAANDCLGAFLFEPPDTDLTNALRGNTLIAAMFGRVPNGATNSYPYNLPGAFGPSEAYSGVGTFHEDMRAYRDRLNTPFGWFPLPPLPATQSSASRGHVVNFTAMRMGEYAPNQPRFVVFDPDWTGGPRTSDPAAGQQFQPPPTLAGSWNAAGKYLPKNAPYTYPDLKDFYLASLSPATGQVIVPSFYRPWHFNPNNPNVAYRLAPWNPTDTANGTAENTDWISPEGRLKVLRPRPIDQLTVGPLPPPQVADYDDPAFAPLAGPPLPGLTNYPPGVLRTNLYRLISDRIAKGQIIGYPPPDAPADPANPVVTYSGDLQNLPGGVGPQRMDSLLLDTGAAPIPHNGKFIKPLLSLLVTDLDGLLNLNAHGNIKGGAPAAGTQQHRSYHGMAPYEVNLNKVMTAAGAPATYEGDFWVQARYGSTAGVPNPPFARQPANNAQGFNPRLSLDFARNNRLPLYSLVNWDGAGLPGVAGDPRAVRLPSFGGAAANPFMTYPAYQNQDPVNAPFFADDIDPATPAAARKRDRHPALFNPAVWPAPSTTGTNPFALPASDLRRLRAEYAASLDEYRQMALSRPPASGGPTTVVGQYPAGGSYRLDPAHANRLLLTTLSAGLERGGLGANFGPPSGGALQLAGLHPTNAATGTAYLGPPAAGQDFASAVDGRNARATLGPIDLNRPLADYRIRTNEPLSSVTPTPNVTPAQAAAATLDRQNHARDIFARLVVATGGAATVDPATGDVTVPAGVTVGSPEYNALRYLAQIAANAVDLIDNDDISTPFIWCPVGTTPGSNVPLTAVTDVATLNAATAANAGSPALISARMVFGAEKTRLVINEVYGEVTNDPNDPNIGKLDPAGPMNQAHVRFWVELLNPTGNAYTVNPGPGDSPLGDGSVSIWNDTTSKSPFKVVITRNTPPTTATDVAANLGQPDNVTGDVSPSAGPPVTPDLTFDFNVPAVTGGTKSVDTSKGQYWSAGRDGFVILGPPTAAPAWPAPAIEFDLPPPSTKVISGTGSAGGTTTLGYVLNTPTGKPPSPGDLATGGGQAAGLNRHVVLLRRLANPYLDEGVGNPFVTVDYLDHVPANDAVRQGEMQPAGVRMAGGADGYVDKPNRFAVGKVQPYSGFAVSNSGMTGATFPNSAVLRQDPNPAGAGPKHTLGQYNGLQTGSGAPALYAAGTATVATNPQGGTIAAGGATGLNGGETVMAPFDWLVHFDRPLVNPLELLHLQGVKPHLVTQYTLLPPAPAGPTAPARKWVGNVPWFGVDNSGVPVTDPNSGLPAPAAVGATNTGLHRALDLLRVKPWVYGTAVGGRLHGRVNLNTVQDRRVLLGLLDPQGGNAFTDTEVNALWTTLFTTAANSRTRTLATMRLANNTTTVDVPVAGQLPTYDDLDPADPNYATLLSQVDRPFKPFGAAEFGGPVVAGGLRSPSGLQDTILRGGSTPTASVPFSTTYPNGNPNPRHPYLDTEMVRKLANTTSTVSNVFAVHLTVVWYEVRVDPATNKPYEVDEGGTAAAAGFAGKRAVRYRLGQEAKRETPGDMRQQFFAVVDRSALWVAPGTALLTTQASALKQPPFTAALDRVEGPLGLPAGQPTHKLHLADAVFVPPPPPGVDPPKLVVFADGVPVVLGENGPFQLVVGTGGGAEVVAVQGVDPVDGALRVVMTRPHAAGDLVSNGVPGNPGPQDGSTTLPDGSTNKFDVLTNTDSRYKAVVPFFQKVK